MLTVGSLFAGIGGFDLGLERAGMRVVWQCESDDFCRRVLAKHWPDVPCFHDVRDLSSAAGTPPVDVLCGGFPCQDISYAGAGAGITGARSGLWSEYARLIGELEPRWVIVENVSALLARGLSVVLADLSALGYNAEWDCLPASAFGAPHRRDRIWLVAYPNGEGEPGVSIDAESRCRFLVQGGALGDAESDRRGARGTRGSAPAGARQRESERSLQVMADTESIGRGQRTGTAWRGWNGSSDDGGGITSQGWPAEPDVGRVAYGVPNGMDRLRALGNALVPAIPEWIGQRIMSYEETK